MAALTLADRVRETTTTTGTGAVTLAGAVTGYQSFAAIGNGNVTPYVIVGQNTSEWEVGAGTYTAAGTTLSRDTVISSSNAGSLVNFSAGTKDVFVSPNQERSIYLDSTGNAAQSLLLLSGTFYGRPPIQQYYGLTSDLAGTNAAGTYNTFGVGVVLTDSTIYQFEASIALSKTAGTTSHTISINFGGTFGLNNIGYSVFCRTLSSGYNNRANVNQAASYVTTVNTFTATASMAGATQIVYLLLKGQVSISTGGTFIPQYTLNAAPGGAYATAAGSYFKISALAPAGANVNIGGWF